MKELKLNARFSYITNSLNYCGPQDISQKLKAYISKGEGGKEVIELIKKFEGLYPYLKYISDKFELDFEDPKVSEAYWIGNDLLKEFDKKDFLNIIDILESRGLVRSIAKELREKMPENPIPFHLFHVMYVGVGAVTGSVPTNVQNMDNCRISLGKVLEVLRPDKLLIKTTSLKKNSDGFYLQDDNKICTFDPEIINPVVGDNIAFHWGFACMKLNVHEINNLKFYSDKVIKELNYGEIYA